MLLQEVGVLRTEQVDLGQQGPVNTAAELSAVRVQPLHKLGDAAVRGVQLPQALPLGIVQAAALLCAWVQQSI